MTRKWKDNRGETLVEVLASILIGALSIALLFTAVMASSSMDKTAQTVDEKYNTALNAAEGQTGLVSGYTLPSDAKVTVTVSGGVSVELNATKISFSGGEDAISYTLKKSPP